jgi:hypothetical protein
MKSTQASMSKQPCVASPRPSAAADDGSAVGDGGSCADGDVAVVTIADQRRARCLRNGLILANAVAWLVILATLNWLIFH